ncbi:MAG: DUF3096 domain-containing protein [Methanobacteriota archaeon]
MATPEKMLKKMGVTGLTAAVLMIIFGVLVIVFPNLISWLVGIYLIVVGLVNLIGHIESMKTAKSDVQNSN